MFLRRKKLTLVLGGGGVRGLAHLGILRVLERAGVAIDGIVGTSAGSIVGALYAHEPNVAAVSEKIFAFLSSPTFRRLNLRFDFDGRGNGNAKGSLFNRIVFGFRRQITMERMFRHPAIFKADPLARVTAELMGGRKIEESKIPLYVTALDLAAGDEVVLDRGSLGAAVQASCAVPGFFPPVQIDRRVLCDAGLINNMPIAVARRVGAETVIAVNLNRQVGSISALPTAIEVILRNEEIGTKLINDEKRKLADVVIEPDLGVRHWLDFSNPASVVEAGARAAEAKLDEILAVVRRKTIGLASSLLPRPER